MLDTRIDLPSAAGIQDVFRHLANDLSRTEAIAAEIESAIGQGRKVLVLTERTEPLDAILKALTDKQLSPFMLQATRRYCECGTGVNADTVLWDTRLGIDLRWIAIC